MNNEKNTTAAAAETEVSTATNANFLAMSKSANLEKLQTTFSIVPSYLEIKKTPVRAIYGGILPTKYSRVDKTTGEVTTEESEVAQFFIDGKIYVNKGSQLLSALQSSNLATGSAVELSLAEVKSLAGGKKLNVYDIVLLK